MARSNSDYSFSSSFYLISLLDFFSYFSSSFIASNSNSLFLFTINFLNTKKLSTIKIYSKIFLWCLFFNPISAISANWFSLIPISVKSYWIMASIKSLNSLWMVVYSNLFSSSSSKTIQC